MARIKELRQRKADLARAAQQIFDRASREGRGLTAEEKQRDAKIEAELRQVLADIEGAEGVMRRQAELAAATGFSELAPIGSVGDMHGTSPRPFARFGEFLLAVRQSSIPGQLIHPGLAQLNMASGLGESVPSEGGFLVQHDFASEILRSTIAGSPIASRARKFPISGNGIKMPAVDETSRATGSRWGGVQAYWVAEAGEITKSKPKFRQLELSLHKLAALIYVTDELLQDQAALESFVEEAATEEISFMLDDAIVRGDGAGKPLGILNSLALVTIAKETGQAADTVVYENIVKMWARMPGRSRPNAVWLINQDVETQLHSMTIPVGTGGVPVYMPAGGLSQQGFSTLFGRPVLPIEQAETLGDKGDIVLADLGWYFLADKGLTAASSMHVRFVYDEMVFRFILRVDGQPALNAAITPYKGANSLSPFVTLAARA